MIGLDDEDMKYESTAPIGQGGQHVGRTCPGVKATHVPSGITASCKTERSQHRNRLICRAMIREGLRAAYGSSYDTNAT